MDRLLQYVNSPLLLVILAVLGLAYAIHSRFSSKAPLPDLPWVGKEDGKMFAEARASISSFGKSHSWLKEGYEKVGIDLLLKHWILTVPCSTRKKG